MEILEYCTSELTISKEQYYLDVYKPEYNILEPAGFSKGYTHTPESKAKYSSRIVSEQTLKCTKEFKVILQKEKLARL